ncbi:MAG: hypothetical protein PHE02_12570 [Lachnospiraceae bacterium]|nr:hypothetical protein [Lachnospiraceae bacterium]
MKFYRYLYTSEKYQDKKQKICKKLKWNIGQLNVYVITLSEGDDLLDIFHCALLKQKTFPRKHLFVVGIADGYGEALELSRTIVQDIYTRTGSASVKEYILQQQQK